ncbi:MAG: hypothetical protein K2X82_13425, partial [Gemmataceae bacterium]|nr:hypothetical protein [Gemmataceae bacterium]
PGGYTDPGGRGPAAGGRGVDDNGGTAVPAGRTPGRYLVYGFAVFVVLLFGGSLWLALTLGPAADRFHNPPPKATAR